MRKEVERLTQLGGADLSDLCDATAAAITVGDSFSWKKLPPRNALETYWRGVLLVPERTLLIGRVDGVIAGGVQFVRPTRTNELQAFAARLAGIFVAPWAHGHGLGRAMIQEAEHLARAEGFRILNTEVPANRADAIALYESMGYVRWGTHPYYALVDARAAPGYFFYKDLDRPTTSPKKAAK